MIKCNFSETLTLFLKNKTFLREYNNHDINNISKIADDRQYHSFNITAQRDFADSRHFGAKLFRNEISSK